MPYISAMTKFWVILNNIYPHMSQNYKNTLADVNAKIKKI